MDPLGGVAWLAKVGQQADMVTFNPSTDEAETGRSLFCLKTTFSTYSEFQASQAT